MAADSATSIDSISDAIQQEILLDQPQHDQPQHDQILHDQNCLGMSRPKVLESLVAEIDQRRVDLWFDEQIRFQFSSGIFHIVGPNQFAVDRLRLKFDREIRQAVERLTMETDRAIDSSAPRMPLQVEYVVRAVEVDDMEDESECGRESQVASMHSERVDSKPAESVRNPRQLDFVFCDNNSLARSAVREINLHPGQISPVLFYGPTGCGKSLLLKSLKQQFKRSRMRSVMMSAEQFTAAYLGALNGQGLPMFRRHYRDLDLLLIDDIQFFKGKRATTSEFQHTVDCLLNAKRQIILTSDRPPIELDFMSQELVTRLSGGLVCPVRFPDRQARLSITKQIAAERQFDFDDQVLEMIVDRFPNDIRQISGAMNRLKMCAPDEGPALTVEAAERELEDLVQTNVQHWSMGQIESVICQISGVSKSEIRSSSRQKRICTARMLAMWMSRQFTRSALSEIGTHFGGRKHSTVISATRKVDQLIESGGPVEIAQRKFSVQEIVERVGRNISEAG